MKNYLYRLWMIKNKNSLLFNNNFTYIYEIEFNNLILYTIYICTYVCMYVCMYT